ncbi:MANGANESE SUPEROXIDE DISMUTASE [Encephalitozoon cuniculi GB-M1]|uniref:Superoxide dismutase n=1 Tax=Encephalitozoon cuniculi (strain GB-M1) TaxID=284813 RepID=Q8SQV7_ENCCU|nr:superoxide dismutase SOD2 [Encephalitozoon cuniculi GB-M1]KMV65066.1 superoxide dismutase [Encephalitozoon cuniculi EcunIII-L]UYI26312.1 superoxide dismutase [Encephalitozoon cuniculi]CAD26018.2 MANGANESE SUPEROXIDE DISMUTASE [Encephalitozoon cuniculi GB-M1]
MEFKLPELDYPYDALEPIIDEETMRTHHSKHHQAYINSLEKTLRSNSIKGKSLYYYVTKGRGIRGVKSSARRDLLNFSGGHYNHSLFWKMMCPPGTSGPMSPRLLEYIERSFGSQEKMVKEFSNAAVSLFGSGWVWLCYRQSEGILVIRKTYNQDAICMKTSSTVPILGLDVWEHAYYLKYKNVRSEYVANWWKVVNWGLVSRLFEEIALENKKLCVMSDGSIKFD